MRLVIDTSVAVKWFLAEEDHQTAIALLGTEAVFVAPDLIFTEFATALQKKIKRGETDQAQSAESCASLSSLFVSVTPTLLLFERALDLALAMNHPVQDCIFLACAERTGLRVVTADRKLIQRASEKDFGHLVFGLGEAVEAINQSGLGPKIADDRLEEIIRLNAHFVTTMDDLGSRHRPPSDSFHFVPAEVFGLAFVSPAYQRLKRLIEVLPREQLRDLIALCWLGRGYDGSDWTTLQARAERISGSEPSEIAYVLSLISYLPAGLDRARTARSSSDTHKDT